MAELEAAGGKLCFPRALGAEQKSKPQTSDLNIRAGQCPEISLQWREIFNLHPALSEKLLLEVQAVSGVEAFSCLPDSVLCPTPAGWARSSIGIKVFFLV